MFVVVEYEEKDGTRPFSKWFKNLNVPAALKIRTAVARMGNGNLSNAEGVGQGWRQVRGPFRGWHKEAAEPRHRGRQKSLG